MSSEHGRALSIAQIATGVGILAFWALFLGAGLQPSAPPPWFLAFEHAFPLPDAVLAAGLLTAGSLLWRRRGGGRPLSLACAGGLLFLGLVDFSFNIQNGIYTSVLAEGAAAAAINLWCVALGIALLVVLVPEGQPGDPGAGASASPRPGVNQGRPRPSTRGNPSPGNRAQPKVVLVTGSSSGIGRAVCEELASGGHRVYGASRSASPPGSWTQLHMDVTDEASIERAVEEVVRGEGRIDALVGCAGVSLAGPFEDTTIEDARRHLDINLFGTTRVIRAVLPAMRRQASGRIIVIGSIGGLIGLPFLGYYSAAKFALDGLLEALRTEIAPFNIDATIVHPGNFNTRLGANRVYSTGTNVNVEPAYRDVFERTREFYIAEEDNAPPPHPVARKVARLLKRRTLPVRVVVGAPLEVLGVWGKLILPSRCFEYLFRKAYCP